MRSATVLFLAWCGTTSAMWPFSSSGVEVGADGEVVGGGEGGDQQPKGQVASDGRVSVVFKNEANAACDVFWDDGSYGVVVAHKVEARGGEIRIDTHVGHGFYWAVHGRRQQVLVGFTFAHTWPTDTPAVRAGFTPGNHQLVVLFLQLTWNLGFPVGLFNRAMLVRAAQSSKCLYCRVTVHLEPGTCLRCLIGWVCPCPACKRLKVGNDVKIAAGVFEYVLPADVKTTVDKDACQDRHRRCPTDARNGECLRNPGWMIVNCPKSCDAINGACAMLDPKKRCNRSLPHLNMTDVPTWPLSGGALDALFNDIMANPEFKRSACFFFFLSASLL